MDTLHNNIQAIRSNLIDLLDEVSDDEELNALLKSIKKTDSELYDIMLLLQSNINTDKITNRNNFIKVINKILDIQTNTINILESSNIINSNIIRNNGNNPVKEVKPTPNKSVISVAISKEPKLLYFVFFFIIILFLFIIDLIDPGFADIITHIKIIK